MPQIVSNPDSGPLAATKPTVPVPASPDGAPNGEPPLSPALSIVDDIFTTLREHGPLDLIHLRLEIKKRTGRQYDPLFAVNTLDRLVDVGVLTMTVENAGNVYALANNPTTGSEQPTDPTPKMIVAAQPVRDLGEQLSVEGALRQDLENEKQRTAFFRDMFIRQALRLETLTPESVMENLWQRAAETVGTIADERKAKLARWEKQRTRIATRLVKQRRQNRELEADWKAVLDQLAKNGDKKPQTRPQLLKEMKALDAENTVLLAAKNTAIAQVEAAQQAQLDAEAKLKAAHQEIATLKARLAALEAAPEQTESETETDDCPKA
jgi:hypothetical protein